MTKLVAWMLIMCVLGTGVACLLIAKVFRRPIEHLGFVTSTVVVVLAVTVGPVSGRREALGFLCGVLFWMSAVLADGFFVAWLIRRFHFSFGAIVCAVFLAGLFGLATGYFLAWVDSLSGPDHRVWHEIPAALGEPGSVIVESANGCDWQVGELWGSRNEIAIWNGVVWSVVGFGTGSVIAYVTRRSGVPVTPLASSHRV
ncbi:MAG TPA: hypothetical protein VMV72_04785 [Verrucomicrobiae bacterium]|nr:hypothetical protein [Verrucomicrobiae bacterium]